MALGWTRWIRGLRTSAVTPRPNGRSQRTNWPASCRCLRRGGLGLSARPFVPVGPSTESMISPASIGGSWLSLRRWSSLKTGCSLVAHSTPSRRSCGMKPKRLGTRMPSLLGPSWNRSHPKPFCKSEIDGNRSESPPYTSWWTRARRSSKRQRRITTPRMRRPPKPLMAVSAPPSVKPALRTGKRSSFLVVVPTASVKALSSITAAFRPRLPPVTLVSSR